MTWFRTDDKLHSSPKWRACSKGARALWATAGSWCSDQLTDGHVPAHMLSSLDGTKAEADCLVRARLWHARGHDCDQCPQPVDGWVFHDWYSCNPSRESVLAEREAAKERQRRAREKARASRRDFGVTSDDVPPDVTVPPTHTPTQPSPPNGGETSEAAPSDTPRADVEALCTLLADCIEANDVKRPQVTKRWRDAARLLLDRDGYTADQVAWMIRWATAHEFWRANVLSMPTLREKFDQLKLQATTDHQRAKGQRPSRVEQNAEVARQLAAELGMTTAAQLGASS